MKKIVYFAPLLLTAMTGCASMGSHDVAQKPITVSQASDRCDADYLNTTYAAVSHKYKYLVRSDATSLERDVKPSWAFHRDHNHSTRRNVSLISHDIQTVSMNELPKSCKGELIKYAGVPLVGGHWVKAQDFAAATKQWRDGPGNPHQVKGWRFSWHEPSGVSGAWVRPR